MWNLDVGERIRTPLEEDHHPVTVGVERISDEVHAWLLPGDRLAGRHDGDPVNGLRVGEGAILSDLVTPDAAEGARDW